ncbi:MAG: DinB family protein [Bacteroidetes bacterium]|nr:MAG: DinB family protein [Bacteroidota bacterium]
MQIALPKPDELNDYYKGYLKYISEDDLLSVLKTQIEETSMFLRNISDENSGNAYEPGKWQIKEVVGHLSDTERILSYRALRFARKDETPLAGFDEDHFVENANFKSRSWESIVDEKKAVRQSSIHFFNSLHPGAFDFKGIAKGNVLSVRALLFFIIAHERHHLQVIKERYLKI